jgi:hypothetical protein
MDVLPWYFKWISARAVAHRRDGYPNDMGAKRMPGQRAKPAIQQV